MEFDILINHIFNSFFLRISLFWNYIVTSILLPDQFLFPWFEGEKKQQLSNAKMKHDDDFCIVNCDIGNQLRLFGQLMFFTSYDGEKSRIPNRGGATVFRWRYKDVSSKLPLLVQGVQSHGQPIGGQSVQELLRTWWPYWVGIQNVQVDTIRYFPVCVPVFKRSRM